MDGSSPIQKLLGRRQPAGTDSRPGSWGDHGVSSAMHGAGLMVAVVALVAIVVTVAFALLPQLNPEPEWHSVRVAIETSGALIALFATFLIFGRLRRRTCLTDLLLASAFAALALSNVVFIAVPRVVGWAPDGLTVWGAPLAHSLGAVLFVVAAVPPRRVPRRSGRAIALTGVGMVAAIGLATIFARPFVAHWGRQYAASVSPEAVVQLGLRAHPGLLVLDLLAALLYALAALGFLNRARRLGDEFSGWLAVAATLAAASHVNYALFPDSYFKYSLYAGTMLRFAFYIAILIGCLREIWSYWTALLAAAVFEDRRRMARDLHDGLAQELAYLYRNLDQVTGKANSEPVSRLRSAVERAQIELRSAISALAPPRNQTVEEALAEAVSEVAERFRIGLDLDVVTGVQLSPARTEALVRIACEAVTNAAKHSGAKNVTLRLQRDGSSVRLQVADRGCGFNANEPGSGFGLIAMRERAQSVGGEVHIWSTPGRGSEVDVAV